jgi:hypothetical protein
VRLPPTTTVGRFVLGELGERGRFAAEEEPEAEAEAAAAAEPNPNPEARGILRVLEKEPLLDDFAEKILLKKDRVVFGEFEKEKLEFCSLKLGVCPLEFGVSPFEFGVGKGSTDDFIFGFGSKRFAITLL